MSYSEKRRARFRRGFTPPPLTKPAEFDPPTDSRPKVESKPVIKGKSQRLPLPDAATIGERFVESTLRYFAKIDPDFWSGSERRFFYYRSDFLGKLRLGQHLESYGQILRACQKANFPKMSYGIVEMVLPKEPDNTTATPDVFYKLNQNSEWIEALAELRSLAGIGSQGGMSAKASQLVDFAAGVAVGKQVIVPEDIVKGWNEYHFGNIVREAQALEPRLTTEPSGPYRSRIVVRSRPLPWLVQPTFNLSLNFPAEISKSGCEMVARRIEQIVFDEFHAQRLTSEWLVLARTASRVQARTLFGNLTPGTFSNMMEKATPTALETYWRFCEKRAPWVVAVKPADGLTWEGAIAAINERNSEVSSVEKYHLTLEAAALFDWLRRLPQSKFEWGVFPIITDDILKTELGINVPWSGNNALLFFRLIAEEISRKTPYASLAHAWHDYSQIKVRIEFRKKEGSAV